MKRGIIADDLTGACDAAARAALAGWRPVVALRSYLGGPVAGADIAVLSTASRAFSSRRAAEVVTEAANQLLAAGARPVFKKIDSTLRGPWAAEVAALAAAVEAKTVAVCPAFPACGRTVRDGMVYAGGMPAGMLLQALKAAGTENCVIGDAETDGDLEDFVARFAGADGVLWVGSGGLARHAFGEATASPGPLSEARRWLLYCGSNHPSSRAQVELARSAGIQVLCGAPRRLDDGDGLFIIGGDTAERTLRILEAEAIEICGEALPGVAAGRIRGGIADGAALMTKSGGFGEPDAVLKSIQALGERR